MINENITQLNDPVFDKVTEIAANDQKVCEPILEKFLNNIKEELDSNEEFNLKHGYLALSKAIVYLSQSLCETEEQFMDELNAAQSVAINRVMPAILPEISENGEIIEEGYDLENLSVRRLMLTMGTTIDYIFWRNEISRYSETREEIEQEEQLAK